MHQHLWSDSQWIEGNVVVTPQGDLVNVLRLNRDKSFSSTTDLTMAATSRPPSFMCPPTVCVSHDRDEDRVSFTGGGTKFTIGLDPVSSTYLAIVPQRHPDQWRNRLALSASSDLRRWRVVKELLFHPDASAHGFQYVDWAIDGDDIVYEPYRPRRQCRRRPQRSRRELHHLSPHREVQGLPRRVDGLLAATSVSDDRTTADNGWRT